MKGLNTLLRGDKQNTKYLIDYYLYNHEIEFWNNYIFVGNYSLSKKNHENIKTVLKYISCVKGYENKIKPICYVK